MQLNNSIQTKFPFFVALSLTFLLASCGSYQYVGYDSDGIYNDNNDVLYEEARTVPVEDQSVYKDFFTEKSLQYSEISSDENAIFTDIDSYEGNYNDDLPQDTQTGYAGWGQANENVTINFYDNGWNNWGWNAGFGMGFNNWGFNNWGGGFGWGYNSWGWNAGFGYGYGYGYGWNNNFWCPPGYNAYHPGVNHWNSNRNAIAYNNGRRGSNSLNRNGNISRRGSSNNISRRSSAFVRNNSSVRSRSSSSSIRTRGTSTSIRSRGNRSTVRPRTSTRSRSTNSSVRSRNNTRSSAPRASSSRSSSRSSSARSSGSSSSRSSGSSRSSSRGSSGRRGN